MSQRIYSLAYLSSHRCTPAEAIGVAAQTGYSFVGLRLWPNAVGAPQQHLLGQPEALRETLADSDGWSAILDSWRDRFPAGAIARQQALWADLSEQWQTALAGAAAGDGAATPADNPVLGAIDQTYRRLAEEAETLAAELPDLDPARQGGMGQQQQGKGVG